MRRRYHSLALFLLLLLMVRALYFWFWDQRQLLPKNFQLSTPTNAEALLARGRRIKLCESGIYELELVPGVSDVLAIRILSKRLELEQRAAELQPDQRWQAWQIVKGIGIKTAKKFQNYVAFCQSPTSQRRECKYQLLIKDTADRS